MELVIQNVSDVTNMINYNLLMNCPVFKGLDEKTVDKILKAIHYQIKHYHKNDIIALAGEQVQNLYIILSGTVKGEMIDYSGKVVKIEDIEAPRPLASAFLFGSENQFQVTVTARDKVTMLLVPVTEFLKLLQNNEQVLVNYLNSISSRSQFLSRKLQFLSYSTIKAKMAHFLLQQSKPEHDQVQLKHTQQQLAELFGVTRPSIARVLGEMQHDKIIKIEKKIIRFTDKNRLAMLIQNG